MEFSERVLAAMRQIDELAQKEWRKGEALRPPYGTIGVGAAEFDHVLRATLAEAYLRMLRAGATLEAAREFAGLSGGEAVRKHNAMRPMDVDWQRDADSERAFLDRVDAIATRAFGNAP
jgi:hypothetical protein